MCGKLWVTWSSSERATQAKSTMMLWTAHLPARACRMRLLLR
jgi:hypothetical protein